MASSTSFWLTAAFVAIFAIRAFAEQGPFASGEEVFKEKRVTNSGFFGANHGDPKWPLSAFPPPTDARSWDYGDDYPQTRTFSQEVVPVGGRGPWGLWKDYPQQALSAASPWEHPLLWKRSPSCMSKCVMQGQIHPIMCHSLC